PEGAPRKPVEYLHTEFNEQDARVSPNSRLLAYASDESKQFEIYVQTFPKPGDKKQVSVNGGTRPVWSRDGTELFFIGADGEMTAVEVKGAAPSDNTSRFEAGTPKPLFDSGLGPTAEYDVSKDGRLLL